MEKIDRNRGNSLSLFIIITCEQNSGNLGKRVRDSVAG